MKLTMTLCTLMFAGLAMAPSASAQVSELVDADSGVTDLVDAVIPWPCYIYISTPSANVGHPFIGYVYVKGHTICIN